MRFYYFVWILLSLFLISACTKRPENVLSEKEMVELLAEMQIAEAYADMQFKGGIDADKRLDLGESILNEKGYTRQQLDTTLAWYGRNLDDYSALFDKVDEEIKKREDMIQKLDVKEEINIKELDNIWPFSIHTYISNNSNSNSIVFDLKNIEIQKGTIAEWTLNSSNKVTFKGILGVEYEDGGVEMISNPQNRLQKIQLELFTDTSRIAKRLFGFLEVQNVKDLPVYLDSISLVLNPFDSIEYNRQRRGQRKYGNINSIK